MRVERRLPALSSLRGQMQAHETRLASLGKRFMSVPISEMICSAARFLTPGTELIARRWCERVQLASDQRLDHLSPAHAHEVADHRAQLDVGVFEGLLYAQDVPRLLTAHLLARAYQCAHLLGRAVWPKLAGSGHGPEEQTPSRHL